MYSFITDWLFTKWYIIEVSTFHVAIQQPITRIPFKRSQISAGLRCFFPNFRLCLFFLNETLILYWTWFAQSDLHWINSLCWIPNNDKSGATGKYHTEDVIPDVTITLRFYSIRSWYTRCYASRQVGAIRQGSSQTWTRGQCQATQNNEDRLAYTLFLRGLNGSTRLLNTAMKSSSLREAT